MTTLKKIGLAVCVLAVVMAGYKLRTNRYERVPFPGDSRDEYSNAWVGMSLLEIGFPIGIGGLPTYPKHDFRYINVDRIFSSNTVMGNAIPLDYPWFDHPPLTQLITGGFAYYKGARVFEDAAAVIIRKPVMWAGVVTVGLIFWAGYLFFGSLAGGIAAIAFAISPLMVINSRMVQAENFLVPMFLMAIIAVYYYLNQGSRKWFYLSLLMTGLGIMTKLSGVSIFLSVFLLLAVAKRERAHLIKDTVLLIGVVVGALSIYSVFGLVYDPALFLKTWLGNSNRSYGIGFHSIFELITITKVTGKIYLTDGWPLVGWLSILYLFLNKTFKNSKYVTIPFIVYLATYLFFGSETFGWYRIPFFPFLFLGAGALLAQGLRRFRALLPSVMMLLIPIGVGLEKLTSADRVSVPVSWWRVSIPFILIISALLYHFKENKWARKISYLIWVGMFLLALLISWKYNQLIDVTYWYKVN